MAKQDIESEFTIGALARATGCKPVTIRYYEQRGLLPAPERTASGYRVYTHDHRRRLAFIRRSRDLGFSLDEVRELLRLADRQEISCAAVDEIAARHLVEIEEKIHHLHALEAELRRLLASCRGGKVGECRVIEALSTTK